MGAAMLGPAGAIGETSEVGVGVLPVTSGTADWMTAAASASKARDPPPKAKPCFTSPWSPIGSASKRTRIKPPSAVSAAPECHEPLAATPAKAAR